VRLPPRHCAEVISSAPDGPYELKTILFPTIGRTQEPRIERLAQAELVHLVQSHLLHGARSYTPDWIGLSHIGCENGAGNSETLCHRLAVDKGLAAYRVWFGQHSASAGLPDLVQSVCG
jgi:hypothetical protein